MMKRFSVLVLLVSIGLIFSLMNSGCKKEEPKAKAPGKVAEPEVVTSIQVTFEDGKTDWQPRSKKVKLELSDKIRHGGNSSLKVTGQADETTWSYAGSQQFSLVPGKKYKLTGWMLVESIDKTKYSPVLKCAIYQEGKWATNFFTQYYNLKKQKEWQELSVKFETPQGGNLKGMIALDKGTKDAAINATIYLDDIKVEPIP